MPRPASFGIGVGRLRRFRRRLVHARTLTQGLQQVVGLGNLDGFRLGNGLALRLGLDERSEGVLVAIIESGGVEIALLGVDDVLGKIQHLGLDLDLRHALEGPRRRNAPRSRSSAWWR